MEGFYLSKFKFFLLVLSMTAIIISLSCTSQTKEIDASNQIDTFINLISSYESYNQTKKNEYYQVYLKTNDICLSMNKVNYNDFFNLDVTSPYIKGNNHILVNPKYYLDDSFYPSSLVEVTDVDYIKRENETMQVDINTLSAYRKLFKDAHSLGIELVIFSSFRSYEKQLNIYLNNPDPRYIARPGHSEHQTGLALDISTRNTGLTEHFENTKSFQFLKDNAYKYGFILRYPKDKQSITGYNYEPWHYRFVGEDIATFIYQNNLTLEEYLYYHTILS